jgi:hypothetical protein
MVFYFGLSPIPSPEFSNIPGNFLHCTFDPNIPILVIRGGKGRETPDITPFFIQFVVLPISLVRIVVTCIQSRDRITPSH